MTDEDIRRLADEVLRRTLGPYGFTRSEVASGFDHDGDPSLFVVAHFNARHGVTPGRASVDAQSGLRDALAEQGEDRFPYIRHRYVDEEYPEDNDLRRERDDGEPER